MDVPINIKFNRTERDFTIDPSTVKIKKGVDNVTWSITPATDKFAVDFPDKSPFGDKSYFHHNDRTTSNASETGRFGYVVGVGLVEGADVAQVKSASGPEIVVVP